MFLFFFVNKKNMKDINANNFKGKNVLSKCCPYKYSNPYTSDKQDII